MGTVSVDVRAVDRSERRALLGGSSHAARSSSEDPESNESRAVGEGELEGRVRGTLQSAAAEDHSGNGGRFSEEDAEACLQRLKYAHPRSKHGAGKKSGCRKRRLSSSHLHTTSSTRRFWNFFEFSGKEEICRESRKCGVSKDLVSASLTTHHELEDASRAMSSMPPIPAITPMALAPKTHAYQFDLKATPMNCPRIQAPSQEDNLMSLLDGNPVPRTLKWKLTGYKTLRNEQAGDFAFVPGGETYDLDILSRNDCGESANAARPARVDSKPSEQEKVSPTSAEIANDPNSANTLSLTTKSMENKAEDTAKPQAVEVGVAESAKVQAETPKVESSSGSNDQTGATVGEVAASSAQKLFTAPVMKTEGVKYLPISKPELAPSQMKCQAQPSVQYSSQPPKGISKPAQPVLHQHAENLTGTAKLMPSMESQKQQPPQSSSSAFPTESSGPVEATQAATSGWSPMEQEIDGSIARGSMSAEREAMGYAREEDVQAAQLGSIELSSRNPKEGYENVSNKYAAQDASEATEIKGYNAQSYFAPRSWKQSDSVASNQAPRFDSKSTHEALNQVYESFGWKSRESALKISSPLENQSTSPCAATQARLQGSPGIGGAPQSQEAGAFGYDGSSMSGNSGGGSQKPPSYPPFPPRRASSNSSSPLGRLPSAGARSLSRGSGARRSGASNIFTASMNPSPKRCNDGDEGATEGKVICTKPRENKSRDNKCSRRRSCDRQEDNRKCQKESKPKNTCKRYCCPALQQSVGCDYDLSYCPKDGKKPPKKPKRDPSCLPNEEDPHYDEKPPSNNAGGRQICTDPSRRSNKCERRPRKCDKERRERSCNQERDSCRTRERPCKRQERQSCPRQERQSCPRQEESNSSGREICTKPRRRESCSRRRSEDRDCGNRSAKCTGRRHYTQSAYAGRTNPGRDVKRVSSLPLLTVSLVGVNLQGNKSGQNLADPACQERSYGKHSKPPTCKSPASEKTSNKCKKPPAKCLDKKGSACKKTPAKCADEKPSPTTCKEPQPENKCKQTCGKSKPKKETCGKGMSKSDEYCAKRKKQLGKDKSAAQSEESPADRTAREKKEMLECKKGKSKGKDKKGKKTGLERVISPCKQRQMKKPGGTAGCSTKCIGVPFNCLASADSLTFMRQESKPFNGFLDRSYSTVRSTSSGEFETEVLSSVQSGSLLNFAGDDILGTEGELPLPIAIDNQEEAAEDNSFRQNWFLSWFNGANP